MPTADAGHKKEKQSSLAASSSAVVRQALVMAVRTASSVSPAGAWQTISSSLASALATSSIGPMTLAIAGISVLGASYTLTQHILRSRGEAIPTVTIASSDRLASRAAEGSESSSSLAARAPDADVAPQDSGLSGGAEIASRSQPPIHDERLAIQASGNSMENSGSGAGSEQPSHENVFPENYAQNGMPDLAGEGTAARPMKSSGERAAGAQNLSQSGQHGPLAAFSRNSARLIASRGGRGSAQGLLGRFGRGGGASAELRSAVGYSRQAASGGNLEVSSERAAQAFDGGSNSIGASAAGRPGSSMGSSSWSNSGPLPSNSRSGMTAVSNDTAEAANPVPAINQTANATPWQNLVDTASKLLMIASLLLLFSTLAGMTGNKGVAKALAIAAAALALMVMFIGIALAAQGQSKQGLIFILTGLLLTAIAGYAAFGGGDGAQQAVEDKAATVKADALVDAPQSTTAAPQAEAPASVEGGSGQSLDTNTGPKAYDIDPANDRIGDAVRASSEQTGTGGGGSTLGNSSTSMGPSNMPDDLPAAVREQAIRSVPSNYQYLGPTTEGHYAFINPEGTKVFTVVPGETGAGPGVFDDAGKYIAALKNP